MADKKQNKSAAVAAIIILLGFGIVAFYMPTIMLALGDYSQVLAILFPIVFVLGFFAVFWFRGLSQKKRD